MLEARNQFDFDLHLIQLSFKFSTMNSELEAPFKVSFGILKYLGLWQDGQQSWTYFFVGYSWHIITSITILISCTVSAFKSAENFVDLINVLGMIACFFTYLVKSVNLLIKLGKIKKSKKNLETILGFSASDQFNLRESVKTRVDFVFKVYKALLFSVFISWTLGIFILIFFQELPWNLWFPYLDTSIGFWTANTYLLIYAAVTSSLDMTLDILPGIFMSFAIGLMDELCSRIEAIGMKRTFLDEGPGTSTKIQVMSNHREELIKCLETHKQLKTLVEEIEENFSLSLIFQGYFSSLIMCSVAFVASTVGDSSLKKH